MSYSRLLLHQFRSDIARFWRNPQSRYFTGLMPIVFLVIFATIFKGSTLVDGRLIKVTTFYVPGIMALGIISASFVYLSQAIVTQRENGEFKRLRGTPLPASLVICSRAAVGVVVAIAMSALLLLIGRLLYNVPIPPLDAARTSCLDRRRSRCVLVHCLRSHYAHLHSGSRCSGHQPARPAAVLHLRSVRTRKPDPERPARDRRRVPDPTTRTVTSRRIHSNHGLWTRAQPPARARRMGHRRPISRGAQIPMDAARRLVGASDTSSERFRAGAAVALLTARRGIARCPPMPRVVTPRAQASAGTRRTRARADRGRGRTGLRQRNSTSLVEKVPLLIGLIVPFLPCGTPHCGNDS